MIDGSAEPSTVRVLHVDDEPGFAELVAAQLTDRDDSFAVTTATDVDAGLAALEEEPVDCIVSDYEMPGRDGLDFLAAVREDHPRLPFVLFTGRGSEAVASEAISAGVTDYLQKSAKPDQFTVLANRVRNAVESARTREALERSRDRFEAFATAFPDVAFLIDEEGRYLEVLAGPDSPKLLDDREALVGERFTDLMPAAVAERFHDVVEETLAAGEVRSLEYELDVQAGTRTFDARVAPLEERYEGNRAVVWVARDVTDD